MKMRLIWEMERKKGSNLQMYGGTEMKRTSVLRRMGTNALAISWVEF